MLLSPLSELFYINSLSLVMLSLIVFLSITIFGYSINYMKGDRLYFSFLVKLVSLSISLIMTICADNIFLFIFLWFSNNIILVSLMIHKKSWKEARFAGTNALNNFLISGLFIASGLMILSKNSGSIYFSRILSSAIEQNLSYYITISFLIIGSCMQSALFPFHKWLLSSLNSPTPVSSMMHAGIVNGGGYLLIKLAPLYSDNILILNIIFIMGFLSAFTGTIWKLMQNNNKNMLACSTMAQMGCMIMEIGLGLFSVALTHILLHSMFKSYLFFASGSAAEEKRISLDKLSSITIILSLLMGLPSILIFSKISDISFSFDTRLVILALCYISFVQFIFTFFAKKISLNFFSLLLCSLIPPVIYGLNISLMHNIFVSSLDSPQSLNILHIFAITSFVLSWIIFACCSCSFKSKNLQKIRNYLYVKMLNSSASDFKTITANRNNYNY
jgi:NAD(P)H-quinone oxidoreductase subunit 5